MRIGGSGATFSIADGSVSGTSAGVTTQSQDAGNGWRKFSISRTAVANEIARINVIPTASVGDFSGDGTSGVYIWGAQLEEASTASSYQPILSTFENAFKAAFPSHTLYQDYRSVTPVTAVGEPVGLMLDKSEGLAQGPELVTNGDFATDSDWTKGTGWTISGGVASFSNSTGTAFSQTMSLSAGVYKIEVETTGVGAQVYFNSPSISTTSILVSGSNTVYIAHNGSYTKLSFLGIGNSSFSMDNISVKEVLYDQPDGTLQLFNSPANVPRIEYDATGAVKGLLIEEARTNLYLNSNQFVSPWARIASDIYASAGTSPSGLADAWRWVGDGTSVLYQGTPYVAGDYTVSAWVKSNGAGEDTFRLYGLNSVVSGDFTATSEWVRYSHTFTSASAVNQFSGILYGASRGNVDLLVYGFQIEAGSTPSSYIPTSGSTVTRAAETLTVPAANLPYSSTNMSIQMDGKMTYADRNIFNEVLFTNWISSGTDYIQVGIHTADVKTGQLFFKQNSLGSVSSIFTAPNHFNPNIGVPFNIASRHGSTFINGAINGTTLTANTTPTSLPDLSSTDLNLGSTFMGTIGKFRVWDEDLTDTGIVEAST